MATVWPHGERVAVRFRIDGNAHVTTLNYRPTQAGLEAARRAARHAEHQLRAGVDWETVRADLRGEQRRQTVGTLGYYAQHFLDHAEVERSTLMGYQSAYNRYWCGFDDRPISSLLLSELREHLAEFKVGAKTRRNAVSVLRAIFEVAKRDGVIQAAPTDQWETKRPTVDEPDPYTEAERDALLEALDGIAHRYFLMAFHSGMRTGELLGLEWQHLDKPYALVAQTRVRRRLKATTKTGDSRRVILPPIVWQMLEGNPTRFARSFVFLTPEGHPFVDADWLMEHWQKAHAKAKVRRRLGLYPWRHTYVSLALSSGASMLWVSRQTGHDVVTMEKHYARWIEGREDADREQLGRIYG